MDSDRISIDLDDLVDNLTMGEVESIEAITGLPISHAIKKEGLSGTTVMALAFVLKRRTNPNYSLEQARSVRFADVNIIRPKAAAAEPDPTPATG